MAEYVERSKALDEIEEFIDLYEEESARRALMGAARYIRKIPAADVRPVVHGCWLDLTDCSNSGTYCSVCAKKIFNKPGPHKKKLTQFCPNCGADMREDDNG